jgi:hypothetical protein
MVAQQVVDRAAAHAHSGALPGSVVVLDHRAGAAGPLEIVAYIGGGHAAQRAFDPPPIPGACTERQRGVHKAGAGCPAFPGLTRLVQ